MPDFAPDPKQGDYNKDDKNYMVQSAEKTQSLRNARSYANDMVTAETGMMQVDKTGKTPNSKTRSAGTAKEYPGSKF